METKESKAHLAIKIISKNCNIFQNIFSQVLFVALKQEINSSWCKTKFI